MSLAPDDPRHGTRNGYNNLHCRCDACRKAAADAQREYTHRTGRRKPREFYIRHGWARYRKGCRCDVCRAAAAAQKRRQHANNIEKYRQVWRDQYHRRSKAS